MKGKVATLALLFALVAGWNAAPAQAQQLCIKAPRANLRAGPGTDYRITWEVNRYMPLIQIDKKGNWVKVKDVDGDTHWVFESLVDAKLDCVTVQSKIANIRKGPSVNADKWFTVQKYTSFKRVGTKSKWVKIEYEGQAMWVYFTLVWPAPS